MACARSMLDTNMRKAMTFRLCVALVAMADFSACAKSAIDSQQPQERGCARGMRLSTLNLICPI